MEAYSWTKTGWFRQDSYFLYYTLQENSHWTGALARLSQKRKRIRDLHCNSIHFMAAKRFSNDVLEMLRIEASFKKVLGAFFKEVFNDVFEERSEDFYEEGGEFFYEKFFEDVYKRVYENAYEKFFRSAFWRCFWKSFRRVLRKAFQRFFQMFSLKNLFWEANTAQNFLLLEDD